MKSLLTFAAATFLLLPGCVTPPEVKQAIRDKDDAYTANREIAERYHALADQSNERLRLWYVYVQSRAKLNLAIQWITGDVQNTTQNVQEVDFVDQQATVLSFQLVTEVNKLRLNGLRARSGKTGPVFEQGKIATLDPVIHALPKLARLARESAIAEFDVRIRAGGDPQKYRTYLDNTARLQKINATVEDYLKIDVTVKGDDVKELAAAIRKLSQSK